MYLAKGKGRDDSLVARLRGRLPVRVDGVHVLLVLEASVLDGLVVRERGRGLGIKLLRGGFRRLEAEQSPRPQAGQCSPLG